MAIVEFHPKLNKKQWLAFHALANPGVDEIMFGGAKYGGKSWFLCVWAYIFACNFAAQHQILQSDHPLEIGFIGRKVAKHFKKTTLDTWFRTIPAAGFRVKGDPVQIIIDDRVAIATGGLDNRECVKQFNSAEYAFFCIDQAEETTRDDVTELRAATFGRMVINEKPVDGKAIYTANPAVCWLKEEFIDKPTKRRRFISALPTDNPYCTQKYINNLKDAYKHRPSVLRAYLYGYWDELQGINQVILQRWIQQAADPERIVNLPKRRIVCCDPARFGDDETVIMVLENSELLEEPTVMGKSPSTQISGKMNQLRLKYKCWCSVETTFMPGVADELRGHEANVIEYNPATSPDPMFEEQYDNLRAQVWGEAGVKFCEGKVQCHNMYEKLEKQLMAPTYFFRNGKVAIEKKKDIKKRLIVSPDHGDCYTQGLWAIEKTPDMTSADWYKSRRNKRRKKKNAMA